MEYLPGDTSPSLVERPETEQVASDASGTRPAQPQPARAGRRVERSDCNLLDVCEEVKAVYPDQVITTEFSADLRTQCDVARMEQATGQAAKQRRQHGDAAARSRSPGE
jgi:hypothetical protein